jgi:hypothetical protein
MNAAQIRVGCGDVAYPPLFRAAAISLHDKWAECGISCALDR